MTLLHRTTSLNHCINVLTVLTLLLAAASPAAAVENGLVVTDDVLLKLGDAFSADGEYYRAITEYKKLPILFPQSRKLDEALFKVGLSYYRGGEYSSALKTFSSVRESFSTGGFAAASRYYEGLAYFKLRQYGYANRTLEDLIEQAPASDYAARARAARSAIALEEERIAASREELERLMQDFPQHPSANKAKDALSLLSGYEQLPERSPVLAGIMSAVIPGTGYAYAGQYGDAVTAFVVNGLFIAGAATAAHQKNYSTAYLVGALGLPFYGGTIYGSANAARKWNLGVRAELQHKYYATLSIEY